MNWLLLVAAAWTAFAQTPSEAQRKYDARDYHGAAGAYAKLVEQDPRNAALHYDLGNALFKEGRLGPAIASYQRAFDILPRDQDIRYNLDFALKKAGEELVPSGVPPLVFTAFTLLSERELAGLHWLGCWAALLLAGLILLRPQKRPALLPWTATAALFWAFWGGWWLSRRTLEAGARGVIIRPTAEIRGGPGDNFNVSFTAPEGRRVQILSGSGGWLEIGVLKEGARGWLRAEAVEKI